MDKEYIQWLSAKVENARADVTAKRIMTLDDVKNKLRKQRIEREKLQLVEKTA
ncbi:hypothetical protein ACWA5Z_00125 [Testudinibacter sp. P80/BLE/0925]|uniref:hypothetical protein n=1 Tax=Testudinibacter sp. TW-1 TaxID=3417757 RepID=UPI003D363708